MSIVDHPRSRGVYGAPQNSKVPGVGSSPLARGLLLRRLPGARFARIIPARAGFTTGASAPPRSRPDHPRSRGVYSTTPAGRVRALGSSPLARGLPTRSRAGTASLRIIPARAGFTLTIGDGTDLKRDHPRSRGVYTSLSPSRKSVTGSSPLARGLLEGLVTTGLDMGIIPARAGFTS